MFVLGLAAVLCFSIAPSGVWTFMEAIGTRAGNGAITLWTATRSRFPVTDLAGTVAESTCFAGRKVYGR